MPREAAWPAGFILGAVLSSFLAQTLDITGVFRLLWVVGGGVVVGFLADRTYQKKGGPEGGGPPEGPVGPR